MIEKVNCAHPDKVADRIAGSIVDLAYSKEKNPKIAVEVLIGHGRCLIIAESSVSIDAQDVLDAVERSAGHYQIEFMQVKQDVLLAEKKKKKTVL